MPTTTSTHERTAPRSTRDRRAHALSGVTALTATINGKLPALVVSYWYGPPAPVARPEVTA